MITLRTLTFAFECGEYGHRIELCPKQNQTDVENSPAAKEVLPNPDPQVGTKAFRTLDATSQQTSQEDHVVSLRIRDHKIANTQKDRSGRRRPRQNKGHDVEPRHQNCSNEVRPNPSFHRSPFSYLLGKLVKRVPVPETLPMSLRS